jgi:hypothetical protein
MNENEFDDWYKSWKEGNEAMEEDIAERCRQFVKTALKDCGETIEARLFEARDEGLITDPASAHAFRLAIVKDLKKRAERRFYKALGEGVIRL